MNPLRAGEGLLDLLWAPEATALLERRRAKAIVARTGMLAKFFCAMALAWIPIDMVVFSEELWGKLALERLLAAAALLGLAAACRASSPSRRDARLRMVVLFAIPAAFFVATTGIFHGQALASREEQIVTNAYAFVPFLMAAGIGAFPLVAAEAAALALIPLAAQMWAAAWHSHATAFMIADLIWLLLLIAMIAAFSAMSQVHLMADLVRQSIHDPLTGCYRRESGKELLDIQFRIARRRGAPLTVLFADLDHFKSVNDAFGHEAGDRVLNEAAAGLRVMLRESDLLLRWGGEEFVVVLPDTDAREAVCLIERLRIHGICRRPDGERMTLSIGIAESVADRVESLDALVDLADRRLYEAKRAGRNCYVLDERADAMPILYVPSDSMRSCS